MVILMVQATAFEHEQEEGDTTVGQMNNKVLLWPKLFEGRLTAWRSQRGGRYGVGSGYSLGNGNGNGYGDGKLYNRAGDGFGFGPVTGSLGQ